MATIVLSCSISISVIPLFFMENLAMVACRNNNFWFVYNIHHSVSVCLFPFLTNTAQHVTVMSSMNRFLLFREKKREKRKKL